MPENEWILIGLRDTLIAEAFSRLLNLGAPGEVLEEPAWEDDVAVEDLAHDPDRLARVGGQRDHPIDRVADERAGGGTVDVAQQGDDRHIRPLLPRGGQSLLGHDHRRGILARAGDIEPGLAQEAAERLGDQRVTEADQNPFVLRHGSNLVIRDEPLSLIHI